MHKKISLFLGFVIFLALFAGFASAYPTYYDNQFSNEHTVKESYNDYGYTYFEKYSSKDPNGEKTSTTTIRDYNAAPYRSSFRNPVNDYWYSGPSGYSRTTRYLDSGYDDAYRRSITGSQYHDYYYNPNYYYNGYYWDWYSKQGCGYSGYCR